jgi:hypothetical protein
MDLDDAFKKVTTPADITVALQQHRDFSQPFRSPHSPPGGTPDPTAKNATKKKPTLTHRQGGDDHHPLHPGQPQIVAGPSSTFPRWYASHAQPGHPGAIEDCQASRSWPVGSKLGPKTQTWPLSSTAIGKPPKHLLLAAPGPPSHHTTSTNEQPERAWNGPRSRLGARPAMAAPCCGAGHQQQARPSSEKARCRPLKIHRAAPHLGGTAPPGSPSARGGESHRRRAGSYRGEWRCSGRSREGRWERGANWQVLSQLKSVCTFSYSIVSSQS